MGALKNGLKHILVQANKEAEDKTVREAAARNSHAVVAEAAIDPSNDPNGKRTKERLAGFEKRRGKGDKKGGKGGKDGKGGDKGGDEGGKPCMPICGW